MQQEARPSTKFWLIGMGGGKRRQQHSQTRRLGFAQALRNASPTTPPAGNPVALELKPPPTACANCAGPRCSRRWPGATARGLAHAWFTGCLLQSQIPAICLKYVFDGCGTLFGKICLRSTVAYVPTFVICGLCVEGRQIGALACASFFEIIFPPHQVFSTSMPFWRQQNHSWKPCIGMENPSL